MRCEALRSLQGPLQGLPGAGRESYYIYVGQTSESCYVRGAEHLDAMEAGLRKEPDKSFMASHIIMTHGGVASEAKFMMKKI